ncbi:hypothetical protein BGX34_008687 [Mortierella sp. NVP85]|nr:hypothetical protein BGX34_008687 [Mortierella sp. NVP85]
MDPGVALVLCHDTEVSLSQLKKTAKNTEDNAMRGAIANAYIELGKVLDGRGHDLEAKGFYKKAVKLGTNVQNQVQFIRSSASNNIIPSARGKADPTMDTLPDQLSPDLFQRMHKPTNKIATIPPHIFAENMVPHTVVSMMPEPDGFLSNTFQLACCLGLLKNSRELYDILGPVASEWLQVVENDEDEQERLKVLALDVVRAFKEGELKSATAISEVVCLAPVIEKDVFRDLFRTFYDEVHRSVLVDIHQVQGLVQLIQSADAGYLGTDDLVKVIGLFSTRL